MYTNIFLTIALLLVSAFVLTKLYQLPRNIWLLFIAQPLAMSSSPVIVFIGAIFSSQMLDDKSLATLPVTLMIVGIAIATIPAAMLAKRKGRKFATLTGFTIAIIASLLATYAAMIASFYLFTLAAFLFGINNAFVQQMRFGAIESAKTAEDIPKVLSILMLSGIFAAFLGPEIAVASKDLINSPHGYAGSFLSLSGLLIISFAIMLRFQDHVVEENAEQGSERKLTTIMRQPVFIIAILAAAIGFALMSYVMTATPLSMHHVQGHSLQDTKWVIQSHIAAMFIPSLFTALLVNKIGLQRLMLVGSIIYAVVIVISFSGQQVMHYWWALLLLGVGWNFLFLTGTSLLPQSYTPQERHKVQATNDFILFGFQALASLLAGWMLFQTGWTGVVISSIPFVVILLLTSIYYFSQTKKQQQLVTE